MFGNVLKLDPYAALVLLEYLAEEPALAVQHGARTGKPVILELGMIGPVIARSNLISLPMSGARRN
jgi:hypothetical protein